MLSTNGHRKKSKQKILSFQNRRLVTTRQRQEIYALNILMTDLERENFNRVCREKGYVMDSL